ncbi:alpha/beta hydrolase [Dyella sp. ASV21]|uniref:alpha/beta fold hydrolase n=1 Tax=Dyella sp. ASV21 TaxID=2795114 RepID=UPI001E5B7533|nr:alpha/beta hydrolase [Dyella sp. ASV21]
MQVLAWEPREVRVHGQRLAYREGGQGPVVVLLHGISSGAASWRMSASLLARSYRVVAWDAPGYGKSDDLADPRPLASAYADALGDLLDALDVAQCSLVGHSLGALIASAYAAQRAGYVDTLVLADPAQGYGSRSDDERERVRGKRIELFTAYGAEGYAQQRAPALLHPDATAAALGTVREAMRQLRPQGFAQANWMLANDDIWRYLPTRRPTAVICGDQDAITPPVEVQRLAQRLGVTCTLLSHAGHASYLDAPIAFAAAVREALALQSNPCSSVEVLG